MTTCPCCSDVLLRHLSSGKLYYLCQTCKIEIPAESPDLVDNIESLEAQVLVDNIESLEAQVNGAPAPSIIRDQPPLSVPKSKTAA